ncbi:hypothetical protein B0H14DRAFT_2781818 [Mycena olivaceomarginata]|nr:hypothetical protein B0H14DRAFT_2781818 [Mycena olivaceomarginata]
MHGSRQHLLVLSYVLNVGSRVSAFACAAGATLVDRVFLEVLTTELSRYCQGLHRPKPNLRNSQSEPVSTVEQRFAC